VILRVRSWVVAGGAALLSAAVVGVRQPVPDLPTWAFPGSATTAEVVDTAKLHHVPNSSARFSLEQAADRFAPLDWHPNGHPTMPPVVASGRAPALWACAWCHLPNGMGRPENAILAGLPAGYVEAQMSAFRSGARQSALASYAPAKSMHTVAMSASDSDVAVAARYFAALPYQRRLKVIEATEVPRTREAGYVHVVIPGGGTERLGERVIEGPPDSERHELRDDGLVYVAYVPPGSIARGRRIATKGADSLTPPCISCHGPTLSGTDTIPPLAGRHPVYLIRQLYGFKTGARATPSSAPMQVIAARLSLDDMIAVAAYAATLTPTTRPSASTPSAPHSPAPAAPRP